MGQSFNSGDCGYLLCYLVIKMNHKIQKINLQNLDEIDKSRVSDDNTRIISTTFVLENLAENKDNIKIISHGSKQISKMISHEDKNLKKILSTLLFL